MTIVSMYKVTGAPRQGQNRCCQTARSSKCEGEMFDSRQQKKGGWLLSVFLTATVSKSLPLSHSQKSLHTDLSNVVLQKGLPSPALTMTQHGKTSQAKNTAVVCILNAPSKVRGVKPWLFQIYGEAACDGGGALAQETSLQLKEILNLDPTFLFLLPGHHGCTFFFVTCSSHLVLPQTLK